MSVKHLLIGAALGGLVAASAMAATPSEPDPLGAHAAIAAAQERLAEMDATISTLQNDADHLDGALKTRAENAVAALRTIRETYRKELDGVIARGRQLTAEQVAVAKTALLAPWTQFDAAVDADVAAVKLDAEQKKALIQARLEAERAYWQKVAADLQASAKTITAEQRAAIEARVARVKARIDDTESRIGRLGTASQSAWAALKKGFTASRQTFEDTLRETP